MTTTPPAASLKTLAQELANAAKEEKHWHGQTMAAQTLLATARQRRRDAKAKLWEAMKAQGLTEPKDKGWDQRITEAMALLADLGDVPPLPTADPQVGGVTSSVDMTDDLRPPERRETAP